METFVEVSIVLKVTSFSFVLFYLPGVEPFLLWIHDSVASLRHLEALTHSTKESLSQDVHDGMICTCQEEYISAIFDSPDSAWIVIHTLVQLLQKLQLPVGDNLAGSSFLTGESPLTDVAPRASSEEPAAVEETLREDVLPTMCYIRVFRLIDQPLTQPCSLYIQPLFHLYSCMFTFTKHSYYLTFITSPF